MSGSCAGHRIREQERHEDGARLRELLAPRADADVSASAIERDERGDLAVTGNV